MKKAYWIVGVDVHDPERYKAYIEMCRPVFERYNAKFLARGGASEAVEGARRARNVVIEFADMEAARACYHSPEYARAKEIRQASSEGEILLVEGV